MLFFFCFVVLFATASCCAFFFLCWIFRRTQKVANLRRICVLRICIAYIIKPIFCESCDLRICYIVWLFLNRFFFSFRMKFLLNAMSKLYMCMWCACVSLFAVHISNWQCEKSNEAHQFTVVIVCLTLCVLEYLRREKNWFNRAYYFFLFIAWLSKEAG